MGVSSIAEGALFYARTYHSAGQRPVGLEILRLFEIQILEGSFDDTVHEHAFNIPDSGDVHSFRERRQRASLKKAVKRGNTGSELNIKVYPVCDPADPQKRRMLLLSSRS